MRTLMFSKVKLPAQGHKIVTEARHKSRNQTWKFLTPKYMLLISLLCFTSLWLSTHPEVLKTSVPDTVI